MMCWKKILLLAIFVICAVPGLPGESSAVNISDYTAFPPFLPRVVDPNILFLVDYSKSMVKPAYGDCDDLLGDCKNTFVDLADDYDSSNPYYGYFDNGGTDSNGDEITPYSDALAYMYTCNAGGLCEKDATSGEWNGNFLNWLTMTQFDVLKKVFVGGDITASPDTSSPASPNISSILTALDDSGNSRQGKFYKALSSATISGRAPAAATTTPQYLPYGWVDYSAANTGSVSTELSTGDDVYTSVSLPFELTFFGNAYSTLWVSSNGFFAFDEATVKQVVVTITDPYTGTVYLDSDNSHLTYDPQDLGVDDGFNNIIAPFWDDWNLNNGGDIKSFLVGEAPNRVFVITFDSMVHWADSGKDDPMTFQVLFYEGTSNIVFQYKKVTKTSNAVIDWERGATATVGLESTAPEDGSSPTAKKYLYLGAPSLLQDQMTLHVTPEVFLAQIVPRTNTPTVFQPAPPLAVGSGLSANNFNVEITTSRVAKDSNGDCASGYYPNLAIGEGSGGDKTKDYCYDHTIDGLFHELSAGLEVGSLGFRLATMRIGVNNQGTDGGNISTKGLHFNEKATSRLLTSTRGDTPDEAAPLSEALYEAARYFQQEDPYWGTEYSNFNGDLLGQNCDPGGNNVNTDPFCFQDADQKVPCVKNFVLLVSSGEYNDDWGTSIDSSTQDLTDEVDLPAGLKKLAPDETSSDLYSPDHGGYLDNVAYYLHTTDLRTDTGLDNSDQVLNLYAVNTFGGQEGQGAEVLKRAALYGAFEDDDGDGVFDSGEGDASNPATYFSASDGSSIKDQIYEAISDILQSSSSGTSVSVLSTSAGGEGALYQAYFYPSKVKEENAQDVAYPGFLRSFFLDRYQQLRDDYSGNGTKNAKLEPDLDRVAMMSLNQSDYSVDVKLYDTDSTGALPSPLPDPPDQGTTTIDSVLSIWEGGQQLAKQDKSQRHIYLWYDADGEGDIDNGDFGESLTGEAVSFTNALASKLKFHLQALDTVDPLDMSTIKSAQTEAEEIIDFIRGNNIADGYRSRCLAAGGTSEDACPTSGENVWPLGDVVYSTPTLVASPAEKYDVIYGDVTYRSFTNQYHDRRQVIYLGANDGMLHAFNAGVYTEGDDDPNDSTTVTGYFAANPTSGNGWTSPTPALGDELWAFIPYDVLPHLAWLACSGTDSDPQICGSAEYTHVYYVDQRPKVSDVRIFDDSGLDGLIGQYGVSHPDGWGTIMIVPMRLGGGAIDLTVDFDGDGDNTDGPDGVEEFRSAYYCFDITDPESPPKLLWRFSHADLGFTTSYPAIARIEDNATGKWFVVVGSGPTNTPTLRDYGVAGTTNAGKLFVVDMKTGLLATTSPFTLLASNGVIGDPSAVDADLDYSTDVIYVGSVYNQTAGRVFRINTNQDTDPNSWTTSTLFDVDPASTKTDPDPDLDEEMGPLLLAPGVSKDVYGNLWVFFGSGRLLNTDDLNTDDQQRFYGIKDSCWVSTDSADGCDTTTSPGFAYSIDDLFNASAVEVTTDKNGAAQVVDSTTEACGGSGLSADQTCNFSTLLATASAAKGWYVDLDTTGSNSERVLSRPAVLGGLVLFTTYEPAGDLCSVLGDSTVYALYYETGTAYIEPVIGTYEKSGTDYVSRSYDLGQGMPTSVGVAIGETVSGFVQKSTGEIVRIEAAPGLGVRSGVDSWRESSESGSVEIETIYKHIVK